MDLTSVDFPLIWIEIESTTVKLYAKSFSTISSMLGLALFSFLLTHKLTVHHKGDFNVNMHLLSNKYVLNCKSILLKRININSIQFNVKPYKKLTGWKHKYHGFPYEQSNQHFLKLSICVWSADRKSLSKQPMTCRKWAQSQKIIIHVLELSNFFFNFNSFRYAHVTYNL